ncbi:MAG TPA: hypothetical protein PK364_08840 [Synergistaceae bacterium]|nr:hypothetical protein [Synergistaceae bacterium]HPJ26305.1 hypothetical protein [Synergistaceae bacterium]HPQ37400.1 hypothetical protein [Synergistaceae bacterium]
MARIYYSLYDRMFSKGNLYQGYLGAKKAKGSVGIDRENTEGGMIPRFSPLVSGDCFFM